MKITTRLTTLLMIVCTYACSSNAPIAPAGYDMTLDQQATAEKSIFSSDSRLSHADVNNILNYQLTLPKESRVAILRLSRSSTRRYYYDETADIFEGNQGALTQKLRAHPQVRHASFLPALLVPEKRTIPYLREAAARYQADILLVYRERCQSYEKYRFVSADETRAFCTVEALMLDIRSGIIPFADISTQSFTAKSTKEEMSFSETIQAAKTRAIENCLLDIAYNFTSYLSGVNKSRVTPQRVRD